ncbi:MAG: pyridoxal-phosphate dependent enzyme [Acidimicrobiales bacterium]
MVPFVELADGLPTPVDELDDGLYVLRDDLTDSHYGGNKVRKLEFALAIAQRRGGPVLTAGATGSHHVYATAVHAGRLGLEVEAVRFPQPDTDHVRDIDERLRALDNVTETRVSHSHLMPFVLAARRVAIERAGGYAILPGATSAIGALGYVSAAVEVVEAFAAKSWAEPDEVVVALGSGGSAIGLSIGFALAGWESVVVRAVRVADALVTNRAVLATHAAGTLGILAVGGWVPRRGQLTIDKRWLGGGYGEATAAGAAATEAAAALGLAVEATYTAKALAAALDAWRGAKRVLFVQTYAGDGAERPPDFTVQPLACG